MKKNRAGKIQRPLLTLIFAGVMLVFILPSVCSAAALKASNFMSLQEMLIKDGFDRDHIQRIYRQPEVVFEISSVSRFFAHREASLNYDQFASRRSIKKARKYMRKHKTDLERVEKDYGVAKEVITAIILVETQLGTVMGNRSVLNTLSTFAALSDPQIRDMAWEKATKPTQRTQADFEKWSKRKSRWAYAELKAFLKYTSKEEINPTDVKGSIAGAMGISQFMPSNILPYARDGNNDGRINLYNHADAIASIASYLKNYGWHPGIDPEKAYKVVFRYNHSKYYVNIILKIAKRLES